MVAHRPRTTALLLLVSVLAAASALFAGTSTPWPSPWPEGGPPGAGSEAAEPAVSAGEAVSGPNLGESALAQRQGRGAAAAATPAAPAAPAVPSRIETNASALAPTLSSLSDELSALSAEALQSVVAIAVWQPVRPTQQFFPFGGPFGTPQRRAPEGPTGQGSGVIVSADGVILTNDHVVDEATRVRVTLADGTQHDAAIVGADPATDLAVLRLSDAPQGLRAMPFAPDGSVQPGALCLAIGNPFGLSGSVSLGIVSATGRSRVGINDFEDFIQTDAAINPGNSGGALIDTRGRLIGLNSAIFSRSGGSQGIGFAIPVNMVREVMDQLLANGRVARGWLGVRIDDVPAKYSRATNLPAGSVLIASVDANAPAALGGLEPGDIVTSVDGAAVASADDFRRRVASLGPGHRARFDVVRDGATEQVTVELGERPEPR